MGVNFKTDFSVDPSNLLYMEQEESIHLDKQVHSGWWDEYLDKLPCNHLTKGKKGIAVLLLPAGAGQLDIWPNLTLTSMGLKHMLKHLSWIWACVSG